MRTTFIRAVVVVASLAGVGAAANGCELIVALDRSAVDAGEDAGCPICTDDLDGGDDSDDSAADADAEGIDAETSTADAGTVD